MNDAAAQLVARLGPAAAPRQPAASILGVLPAAGLMEPPRAGPEKPV
jgi:hypothetical protein